MWWPISDVSCNQERPRGARISYTHHLHSVNYGLFVPLLIPQLSHLSCLVLHCVIYECAIICWSPFPALPLCVGHSAAFVDCLVCKISGGIGKWPFLTVTLCPGPILLLASCGGTVSFSVTGLMSWWFQVIWPKDNTYSLNNIHENLTQ